MSTQQKPHQNIDIELEKNIVKYLRDHPDFFERHLDLLADMILPHEHNGTVSLIERQVSVLREQKDNTRRKLQALINNAEQNDQLMQRINDLVLALLDSHNLDEILDLVQQRLVDDFNADCVVIRLFNTGHPSISQRPEIVDWSEPVMGAFEKVIKNRQPVCGNLKPGQLDSLFSEQADFIASAALIPLIEEQHSKTCYGMLAIGSSNPDRFRADMGTLFLSHLGKVITRILKPHLVS